MRRDAPNLILKGAEIADEPAQDVEITSIAAGARLYLAMVGEALQSQRCREAGLDRQLS